MCDDFEDKGIVAMVFLVQITISKHNFVKKKKKNILLELL